MIRDQLKIKGYKGYATLNIYDTQGNNIYCEYSFDLWYKTEYYSNGDLVYRKFPKQFEPNFEED